MKIKQLIMNLASNIKKLPEFTKRNGQISLTQRLKFFSRIQGKVKKKQKTTQEYIENVCSRIQGKNKNQFLKNIPTTMQLLDTKSKYIIFLK